MLAREPGEALALEVVEAVDAEAAVHARVAEALVDLLAAVLPRVAGLAGADKVIDLTRQAQTISCNETSCLVNKTTTTDKVRDRHNKRQTNMLKKKG